MKNEKIPKGVGNWIEALSEIKYLTKKLDEKPALIVYRTGSNNFRGFLNQKAIKIAKTIVGRVKYCWLDVFTGRDGYFVDMMLSEKYQSHAISDNTSPCEPGSYTLYPYSEIRGDGQFDIQKISGNILFSKYYFGPSFIFFFLCGISKDEKSLYFNS